MLDENIESEFSKEILNLLEYSSDCNVKIIVGKEPNDVKEFKVHSLILCTRSEHFQKALSKEHANEIDGYKIFREPNISPPVFDIVLKYIYSGFIPFEEIKEYLIDVLIAADELKLHQLFKTIEVYIIKKNATLFTDEKLEINPFQIIGYYEHFKNLHDFILELICKSPKKFFQSKEFLEIKEDTLMYLLKRNDLEMEEINILEHLIMWGFHQLGMDVDLSTWTSDDFVALEKTLHNFIPLIRFFQIPYEEYYSKIRIPFRKIIPEALDDDLLDNYLNPNMKDKKDKMPPRTSAFPFDSEIIDAKDAALISSWIDWKDSERSYAFNKVPYKFKLLLRGSRDGFGSDIFHKLCDNKGPTIIVAKVRDTDEIIGGYNPLEWKRKKLNEHDELDEFPVRTKKSFIFSLTDRANPILSRILPDHINKAIILDYNRGALFGESDLWMDCRCSDDYSDYEYVSDDDEWIENKFDSWRCQQSSYEHKIIEQENFEIEDYEVFQVTKKVNLIKPTVGIMLIFIIIYKIVTTYYIKCLVWAQI